MLYDVGNVASRYPIRNMMMVLLSPIYALSHANNAFQYCDLLLPAPRLYAIRLYVERHTLPISRVTVYTLIGLYVYALAYTSNDIHYQYRMSMAIGVKRLRASPFKCQQATTLSLRHPYISAISTTLRILAFKCQQNSASVS